MAASLTLSEIATKLRYTGCMDRFRSGGCSYLNLSQHSTKPSQLGPGVLIGEHTSPPRYGSNAIIKCLQSEFDRHGARFYSASVLLQVSSLVRLIFLFLSALNLNSGVRKSNVSEIGVNHVAVLHGYHGCCGSADLRHVLVL